MIRTWPNKPIKSIHLIIHFYQIYLTLIMYAMSKLDMDRGNKLLYLHMSIGFIAARNKKTNINSRAWMNHVWHLGHDEEPTLSFATLTEEFKLCTKTFPNTIKLSNSLYLVILVMYLLTSVLNHLSKFNIFTILGKKLFKLWLLCDTFDIVNNFNACRFLN